MSRTCHYQFREIYGDFLDLEELETPATTEEMATITTLIMDTIMDIIMDITTTTGTGSTVRVALTIGVDF